MNIKENLIRAINDNEVPQFLRGDGKYNIPDRNGLSHNYSASLVEGVYEAYKDNAEIKLYYENALNYMINNGSLKDLLYAFDYIRLQIKFESMGYATFELNKNIYLNLKNNILKNKENLSQFREITEYGSQLPNASYQFIENMDRITQNDYGRSIL